MPRIRPFDTLLFAVGVVFVLMNAMGGRYDFQSDHRLFPLFLFADGKAVYSDPLSGPIAPSLYPPLSFLAFFPSLLFRTPGAAILCSKLLAQCYTVGPLLWVLWRRRSNCAEERERTLLLMVIALAGVSVSDVLSQMTNLHADAPALFLLFCVCVLTDRSLRNPGIGWLFAVALCSALAPWAKQPAAPIVLVPVVYLLVARRWKIVAEFCALYLGLQMFFVGLFYLLFRGQPMFFWLFHVPSDQLLRDHTTITIIRGLARVDALVWILLALVLYQFLSRYVRLRGRQATGVCLEDIFVLASLVELVPSLLGFLFPGGSNNALLYFAYPAFAFVLLRLHAGVLPSLVVRNRRWAAATVAVALIGLSLAPLMRVVSNWSLSYGFNVDVAYRYMRRHPGQVWFPRYPLTSYLAEGKVYHSEMGFLNVQLLGIPISQPQLLKYIPGGGRVIACAADCQYLLLSLDGYRQIPAPELPGTWSVFEQAGGATISLKPPGPER